MSLLTRGESMKRNLGSVFITIFILFTTNIFASKYTWNASVNKKTAHINEAIHLVYKCQFEDRAELSIIDFNPVGTYENYDVELLKKYDKYKDGKRISFYEFIVFAKKEGVLEFEFDTVMKTTTQDSINNTVLGRDNADYEQFSKTKIKQKKLSVEILSINEKIKDNLIGDFNLNIKLDKTQKSAYEPYHLEIAIDGYGSLDLIKPIEFSIEGVKVFSQKPILEINLNEKGRHGIWIQKFAFTSDKSFSVPALNIKYFDLNSQNVKTLHMEKIDVDVKQSSFTKDELLDKEEKSFEFDIEYIYYILSFISGFLVAKIKINKKATVNKGSFHHKVQSVQSLEELMILLALEDTQKYKHIIEGIESKKITSLKKAKYMVTG